MNKNSSGAWSTTPSHAQFSLPRELRTEHLLMSNNIEDTIKHNQQQAAAAWIEYLNNVRNQRLLEALAQQDVSLQSAVSSLEEAIQKISAEIVETNRGGIKGMHGFIAEVAQVGVGNARAQIRGVAKPYELVNNNGPIDIFRDGTSIQMKFSEAGGNFSLGAVLGHMRSYPDYVSQGGKYQIPADHYDVIKQLTSMSPEVANQTLTKQTTPSIRDWKHIQELVTESKVPFSCLEGSDLAYSDVQVNAYQKTLQNEASSLHEADQELRLELIEKNSPTLREGLKTTAVTAAMEGMTAFVLAVISKRREGKQFAEFTPDDWTEITAKSGYGTLTGSIRGTSIYVLTNFTATPAAAANALATTAIGVAEQAYQLRRGTISEIEFWENSEALALQAAVSALSATIGQAVIPIPILGAVIGNSIGTVLFKASKDVLNSHETRLIELYQEEQARQSDNLRQQDILLIEMLQRSIKSYLGLISLAFSLEPAVAFEGSIQLATTLDVPTERVLRTNAEVLAFFTE
ncbi:MAG: hypothetical protein ACRDAX_08800 [Propionibacteriaceae bacterium]